MVPSSADRLRESQCVHTRSSLSPAGLCLCTCPKHGAVTVLSCPEGSTLMPFTCLGVHAEGKDDESSPLQVAPCAAHTATHITRLALTRMRWQLAGVKQVASSVR